MKNSTKRIISIFISMIFFIASLLVYIYLIKPSYEKVLAKKGEWAAKESQYEEYKDIIKKVKGIVDSYQNSDGDARQSVDRILPPSPEISRLVAQVNGLSSTNGLSLQNLSAREMSLAVSKDPALIKSIGTVKLTFNAAGSYEALIGFLKGLESNVRIFDVIEVKIQKTSAGLAINFDVDSYYQGK